MGRTPPRRTNFQFSPETNAESPCAVAVFVLNSEPQTEARPSFRVYMGLK
jgi:hypothetical protein